MTDQFIIEPLSARHDRASFSCGVEALDRYLQTQVNQDIRRHISNCFVAIPDRANTVAGYDTLAASSIPLTDIPVELSRKLPRYPVLPAVPTGRLAVDRYFRAQSLGFALLYDAIARTLRADSAAFAIIVDAKDEIAASLYSRFGFRTFQSNPLSLFLPLATASKLLE